MGVSWEYIKTREAVQQKELRKKIVAGATNFKNEPYQIVMIGDLDHFYSYDMIIKSEIVEAGMKIHIGYTLQYEQTVFAEKYMHSEWKEFVRENGLTETWESHLSGWKKNNPSDSKEGEEYDLYNAKRKYHFMTKDELEKVENDDNPQAQKDNATRRSFLWGEKVFKRFNELIENPAMKEEWRKIEERETPSAEKSFLYEYNYRSSITKALHKRLRKALGFKTEHIEDPWEQLLAVGRLEHIRWNAYMRTERYRYAPNRNDLGKEHHNLVPVSQLTSDDLRKDV